MTKIQFKQIIQDCSHLSFSAEEDSLNAKPKDEIIQDCSHLSFSGRLYGRPLT